MGIFQRLFASRRASLEALSAWQDQLDSARALMDDLSFTEATAVLVEALADSRSCPGPEATPFRAAILSSLGECHFQNGDPERAVVAILDGLRQHLPPDLEQSLRGNLYEVHRYLSQSAEAAAQVDRLADLAEQQGQEEQAVRYRRQAALVRVGEPPCRVVVNLAGTRLEIDEVLAGTPGRLSFLIERNRLTLRTAQNFLEMGAKDANEGRFAEALSFFRAAGRSDRFAPQPHLQTGLMLLYLQRPAEAISALQECERLAPGWPLARTALCLARLRADARLSHEVFRHWHALEEGPLSPEMKIGLAEQALAQAPDLPHLHHLRGKSLRDRNLVFAAEKAYRRALELAPPPDLEARVCVDLAAVVGAEPEKQRLLRHALDRGADLIATATARIILQFD